MIYTQCESHPEESSNGFLMLLGVTIPLIFALPGYSRTLIPTFFSIFIFYPWGDNQFVYPHIYILTCHLYHVLVLSDCNNNLRLMANLVYQRLVKDTSTTAVELKEGTSLQSAALLLKCFKILENATFLSDNNKVIFQTLFVRFPSILLVNNLF
jgi:hypothetical protein